MIRVINTIYSIVVLATYIVIIGSSMQICIHILKGMYRYIREIETEEKQRLADYITPDLITRIIMNVLGAIIVILIGQGLITGRFVIPIQTIYLVFATILGMKW